MLTYNELLDFSFTEKQSYYNTIDKQLGHVHSGHMRLLEHVKRVFASSLDQDEIVDLIDHWKKHQIAERAYLPFAILGLPNKEVLEMDMKSHIILDEIEDELKKSTINVEKLSDWLVCIGDEMDEEENWLNNLRHQA